MAKFDQRVPQNVPGRFYVDKHCIYCELCVETAPHVFRESKEKAWAYVFTQPSGEAEVAAAMDAAEGCPTKSIGFDGDHFEWGKTPSTKSNTGIPGKSRFSGTRGWLLRRLGSNKG